jgi:hypothetical protein
MARKPRLRLKRAYMPKKFDGSGCVGIQCTEDTYESMKLGDMPIPPDKVYERNGYTYMYAQYRSMGADAERYRVMWPEPSTGLGTKLRTSSFTLSATHTNETLFVLAEWLRSQSVNFVALTNKHGNAFKRADLGGSDLAYLCTDVPHTLAPDVYLIDKPFPKNS